MGGCGIAVVVDMCEKVLGVITAGDLMRSLQKTQSLNDIEIDDLITENPIGASVDTRLVELKEIMASHNITSVVIENSSGKLCGLVHYNSLT